MFFLKKKWGKNTEIIECPIYGKLCTSVVHVFKGWQLLFSVYREWKQISERRSIFLIIPNHLLTIVVKVQLFCHWGHIGIWGPYCHRWPYGCLWPVPLQWPMMVSLAHAVDEDHVDVCILYCHHAEFYDPYWCHRLCGSPWPMLSQDYV